MRINGSDDQNARRLKEVCRLCQGGRFEETIRFLADGDQARDETTHEPLAGSALFWKGTMEAAAAMERYAASEFLVAKWDEFTASPEAGALPESVYYAVKEFVYNQALLGYRELYNLSGIADTGVLERMGRLYHGLGDYERAIQSFELAHQQAKDDPRLMAGLADSYALAGETKASKLLFREAFFVDPAACGLPACEAPFIRELAARLAADGVPEAERAWWLPVYGAVLGVFNVKRELKPVEIARLTQSIRELEAALGRAPSGRDKARLLNRYLWLADHYASIKAPQEDLAQVLAKIKTLDPNIYERYVY